MKIFIGLMEIAGYYGNLKWGLQKLGFETVFIDLEQHTFSYGHDDKPNLIVKLVIFFSSRRRKTPRSQLLRKVFWKIFESIFRIPLFLWALFNYDVFIFSGNVSFFFFLDLPILRFFNKKIIYVFNGSEARPPYIDGQVMGANKQRSIHSGIRITKKRKRTLQKIERYTDVIISHPYYGQFHEKPFVHFNHIGFPYEPRTIPTGATQPTPNTGAIRILHSPSDPEGKGTLRIRQIIEAIRAKGYPIEFVELTGKTNIQVMNELQRCDFVIDQLYSDLFVGAFGTEASYFGKPVVISGYGLEECKASFPQAKIPPTEISHPDNVGDHIEKLITNRAYRLELGQRAQEFIHTQWNPTVVASRVLQLINADIPQEWLCYPDQITYLHGYGFPEAKVQWLISEFIRSGGQEVLLLADKPQLQQRFIEFANQVNTQDIPQSKRVASE